MHHWSVTGQLLDGTCPKDPAKHAAILGIQGRGTHQALVRLCVHLDKGCEGFWAVAQPG